MWFRGGLVLGRGIDLVVSLREGSGDKTVLSKSLCDRLLSEKDKGLATSLSLSVIIEDNYGWWRLHDKGVCPRS